MFNKMFVVLDFLVDVLFQTFKKAMGLAFTLILITFLFATTVALVVFHVAT